ncbi:HD family phosphohydrolase [Fusobacterium perfoetens]|uniref:HD family phosphohydrolase n=1 Tax=Fusobacterium perfoetens TaxID=852 RepID=UPI001F2E272A|nr:HDIG domain-containing metalloprotein [Fusobacterium perfoetens]MCF2612929.1 HDIG domain-containing protein [Fusobacterium perfoetens]
MKKFNFLGFRFLFRVERENRDDVQVYSDTYQLKDRMVYFLVFLMIISLSSQLGNIFQRNKYIDKDIIKENIYAPRDVKYKDVLKREAIIKDIVEESEKKYIYLPEIGKKYSRGLNEFYDEILQIKEKKIKNFDYDFFEENYKLKIAPEIVDGVLDLSKREINSQRKDLMDILDKVYSHGIREGETFITTMADKDFKDKELSNIEFKVLDIFTFPNYVYDRERTKFEIKKRVDGIEDQYTTVKAGELVLKKGELLNKEKIQVLNALGIYSFAETVLRFSVTGIYLITVSVIAYNIVTTKFKKELSNKNIYGATFLVFALLFFIFRFFGKDYLYLIPFETGFFLLQILVNSAYAFYFGIIALIYITPMINYDMVYFVITLLTILFATRFLGSVKTRVQFINLGIQLAIVKLIIYFSITFLTFGVSETVLLDSTKIILAGIFSGVLTLAIVPYLERSFNILSSFKLLELGDLSNPLLRDLSVKTPGTFYHSMMVAAVSEAAAEAIGADPIFTRVASYYHDIGKMKRPKFYVENQEGGENPHDKISPFLSALVILAHTKDGFEMAKKYKVPREIRDIMLEHHGTTFLAYFYNKAKSLDENVREDDFRYSGPKPKTKESAIIMLADSIEAAVRSIEHKTYNNIEEMIRKIIFNKLEDGQLKDADLTFKDIETIIKVFTKTIIGIHHVRIKYPGQEKESEENKTDEN